MSPEAREELTADLLSALEGVGLTDSPWVPVQEIDRDRRRLLFTWRTRPKEPPRSLFGGEPVVLRKGLPIIRRDLGHIRLGSPMRSLEAKDPASGERWRLRLIGGAMWALPLGREA